MNKIIKEDINNILSEDLDWHKLKNKSVLVSGASGFIPSYVVEVLLALKTTKVIALVRNKEKAQLKFKHHNDNKNLQIIEQDISEPFELDEKIDYIIHAASQASPKYYGVDPVGTLKANSLGTAYLLDIAKKNKVEKFLFFSSCEVYGVLDGNQENVKEIYTGNVDVTDVRSCYAESKRMGENMCVCYSHQFGFDVNMIRLSHTYGPGVLLDDGRVFGDFVKNVINNENIILNSDGSAKRSFCYVSDMIVAMFMILFNGKNKNAYNIAYDNETTILNLAEVLVNIRPEKGLKVEFAKDVFKKGYMKSMSQRASFSTEKLKKMGWKQKINLQEGFERMIKSYE